MSIIPTAIARPVFRTGLILKKASPNLMFGVGIVGVVGATALACRATLKLAEELPDMRAELDELDDKVIENEKPKALAYVYGKNVGRVAQLYAPAVIVGAASIGLLTGSHVTLNRRNAGLTAAYAAVSQAYDQYRDRVRLQIGDDKELALYRNTSIQKVELPEGKHAEVLVENPSGISAYGRIFDETNAEWQRNAEHNRFYLHCQQNFLNHLLNFRGHVFLNEAYEALGFEHTKAGSVVGWIRDGEGDGFIDFGLFDEANERFALGWEQSIWLDFNVDGVIYDRI